MNLYKNARPVLFAFDPEFTHDSIIKIGKVLPYIPYFEKLVHQKESTPPKLRVDVLGLNFQHPIGLAAGFDKNAEILRIIDMLGFSFSEIGAVTPLPQKGNPKPRLFRLPNEEAIINKMGFNNIGVDFIKNNLSEFLKNHGENKSMAIGANLGKNKDTPLERAMDDYAVLIKKLYPVCDYFVLNISSPNTPGLRELQNANRFMDLTKELSAVMDEEAKKNNLHPKPILVKISPDLTHRELDNILDCCLANNIKGIIATNTTISRKVLRSPSVPREGGISGLPLKEMSNKIIQHIYKNTSGKITIIGVGGIFSTKDVIEKMESGANLVQIYTGLIYKGPLIINKLCNELAEYLRCQDIKNIKDIVGINTI